VLPPGFRNDANDTRILSVALALSAEGHQVTLVSKDMPLRVKGSRGGAGRRRIPARSGHRPTWTGMAELELSEAQVNSLYAGESLDVDAAAGLPCHTGLVLHSPRGSALGRVQPDKTIRLVRGDRERSDCTAARPSSGWRWTCCWTTRSGSCRWAAGPAPASPRWPCAPAWSR